MGQDDYSPDQESSLYDDAKQAYNTGRDIKDTFDELKNASQHAQQAKTAQQAAQAASKGAQAVGSAAGGAAAGAAAQGASASAAAASTATAAATTTGATAAGSTAAAAGTAAASATATGATAGSAAGPAGTLVGAAVGMLVDVIADPASDIIKAAICILLFWFVLCGTLVGYHSSAEVRSYAESEYGNSVEGDKQRAKDSYRYTKDQTRGAIDSDYDHRYINEKAAMEFKQAVQEEVEAAFKEQLTGWADDFDGHWLLNTFNLIASVLGDGVYENHTKSLQNFYKAKYPYACAPAAGEYYTIGDYLKSVGFGDDGCHVFSDMKHSFKYIAEKDRYDDLNFAEVFAIITEGTEYNTRQCTIQDFRALFHKNEFSQEHLYEIELKQTYHTEWEEPDGVDENGNPKTKKCEHTSENINDQEFKDHKENLEWYYTPTIYPYGLVEMYELALGLENDESSYQQAIEYMEKPFEYSKYQTNEKHLDWIEYLDRLYCRMDKNENGDISKDENYLGPSYETNREPGISFIYNKGKPNPVKTGRSARYYIDPEKQAYLHDRVSNGSTSPPDNDSMDDNKYDIPTMPFDGSKQEFFDKIKEMVMKDMRETGILASLTAAQAALESSYGTSGLTKDCNNLFGIKGEYQGHFGWYWTWEVYNGVKTRVRAKFRAYPSWAESIADHSGLFLRNPSRYGNLIGETDWIQATYNVRADGYATDPAYVNKLRSIIKTYHLDEWDQEVLNGG